MAPKCLPPELLFELVPLFPVEETLPNVFLSCRLLHNFLLPRVDKWKEEMQRNTEEMDRKFEEMEKRLTTKFEQFREDTFELLDTIVERIEDGNKEIAHFCRHTAQTMDLLALNITTSVSAFKRRKQQCGQDTDSAMTAEGTFGGGQLTAAAPSAATSAARGGEFSAKANNFETVYRQRRRRSAQTTKFRFRLRFAKGDWTIPVSTAPSSQILFPTEARFMSSLDEMNSVMNGLRSSIDAEEATKLKQIIEHLVNPLFTPLSGIQQHSASELRGQLPCGTDANVQPRAPQRQPAKSFELFETAPERKESAEKGQTKQGKKFAAAAGLTSSNESNSLFTPLSGIQQHSASELRGQLPRGADANPTEELDITDSTSTPPFLRNLSGIVDRVPKLFRTHTYSFKK